MPEHLNDTAFLLQSLMENMTDHIYFKDAASRFIMVNKAFSEWAGLDQQRVAGKTDFDLFAREHAQPAFEDEQRIVATGEPLVGIEEKETWPDGRVTWVSTTKMPLKSKAGETIGTFGISRDITEHKEAELRAARFAEEIRKIKENMEEEMRMAGELQKTFFPSSYPVFPGDADYGSSCVRFEHVYRASGMVSGDFCSIRKLSETEAGIFLCDVMGHGVRAALGTALICALVEELTPVARDPGQFLGRMNELLLPILRQEDVFLYATACYLVVDCSTGTVRLANAGHPVPMRLSAQDGKTSWLMEDPDLRGPALAIVEEVHYPTIEQQLQVEDAVIMYTDGLYELLGPDGEEFGEARLIEVAEGIRHLPLHELLGKLVEEVGAYSAEDQFDDDICLVGFRLKGLLG